MAVLQHHTGRTESGGGAENRPDIARVRHLIQQQHGPIGSGDGIFQGDRLKRFHQQRDTLMHGVFCQEGAEALAFNPLGRQAPGAVQRRAQAFLGVFRHQQPAGLAARVANGGSDRVFAIKPKGAGTSAGAGARWGGAFCFHRRGASHAPATGRRGLLLLEAAWGAAVPARRFGLIFKARAARRRLRGGALRAGAARGPLRGALHRPHDAPGASE